MKKLKRKPEHIRGLKTEERFLELAHTVKREQPWIHSVRKTGPRDDARGIDFTFYVQSPDGSRMLKIPFQVKSSFGGADAFLRQDRLATALGVPVFVCGLNINNQSAVRDLAMMLARERASETDFSPLYQKRANPKPTSFTGSQIGSGRKRYLLRHYREQEATQSVLEATTNRNPTP